MYTDLIFLGYFSWCKASVLKFMFLTEKSLEDTETEAENEGA